MILRQAQDLMARTREKMDKSGNPENLSGSTDPSGDFGRNEGLFGYKLISERAYNPDAPVAQLADHAARIAMVASGRYDLDLKRVSEAIVEQLNAEVVPTEKE